MPASLLLSVDRERVSVAPGASTEFAVRVQNLTTLLDQVAIRVDGVDAAWIQVIPPFLPVFAQGTASARVVVSPPNVSSQSLAGMYALMVAGTAQESKAEVGIARLELEVQLIGDYLLRLGPAQPRGQLEAAYPLTVQNGTNAPLNLRLAGSEKSDGFWFKFEPFQLTVPGGSNGQVLATLRAKQRANDRRAVAFNVSGGGMYLLRGGTQTTAPDHQIAGQFVQAAPVALIVNINPTQGQGELSAIFEVRVGNPGTSAVTVNLEATSEGASLNFRIEPPQLALAAQSEARARLTAQAAIAATGTNQRMVDFRVTATSADGAALPGSGGARFVQSSAAKPFPWVPVIIGLLFLLLIMAGLVLLLASRSGLIR
jgi:hypothetical protein